MLECLCVCVYVYIYLCMYISVYGCELNSSWNLSEKFAQFVRVCVFFFVYAFYMGERGGRIKCSCIFVLFAVTCFFFIVMSVCVYAL